MREIICAYTERDTKRNRFHARPSPIIELLTTLVQNNLIICPIPWKIISRPRLTRKERRVVSVAVVAANHDSIMSPSSNGFPSLTCASRSSPFLLDGRIKNLFDVHRNANKFPLLTNCGEDSPEPNKWPEALERCANLASPPPTHGLVHPS